jgi:hypothetical protein
LGRGSVGQLQSIIDKGIGQEWVIAETAISSGVFKQTMRLLAGGVCIMAMNHKGGVV